VKCFICCIIVSRNKDFRWLCSETTDNISVCRKNPSRFKARNQILSTECRQCVSKVTFGKPVTEDENFELIKNYEAEKINKSVKTKERQ
jgi:ribosomal protein L40E